ncbi:hypothetical protein BGZ96_004922, partial [Linnemannia gamsii]
MPSTTIPVHNSNNSPVLDNSSSLEIIHNHSSQLFSSSFPFVPSSGSPLILSSGGPLDQDNSIGYPPIIYTLNSTPSNISHPQSGLSDHVLELARSVTSLGRWSSRTELVVRSSCGSGSNLKQTSKNSEKNGKETKE